MKIWGALQLALSSVVAGEDRIFADDAQFISAQDDWWYKEGWAGSDKPTQYLENTKGAMQYFKRSFIQGKGQWSMEGMTGWRVFVWHTKPTIRKIAKLNYRCEKQTGKPKYKARAEAQGNQIRSEDGFYEGLLCTE